MPFVDKSINCVECNQPFVWSASEQETYQQRGFLNEPKRCAPCRAARKDRVGGGMPRGGFGGGYGGGRSGGGSRGGERFTAVCADCGREAQLPFKPRGDRPVYCSDCFRNHRA
jgi:CxxC-x17-CxxC domain-containing protein